MNVPISNHFQVSAGQSRREKSTTPQTRRAACRILAARIRALSRNEGGAIMEMALTLPAVLVLMTGIFASSIALNQRFQLTQAVSVGGRVLAVDRGDADPCTKVSNAMYAAAPNLAKSGLTISFNLNGVKTAGTLGATTSCDPSGTSANPNMVSGNNAAITATYPCSLVWFGGKFGSCTLTSQVVEQVQ